jgi:predicted MFS family arabinose efflux permease
VGLLSVRREDRQPNRIDAEPFLQVTTHTKRFSAAIFLKMPAVVRRVRHPRTAIDPAQQSGRSNGALLKLLAFCVPGAALSLGHNSIRPFLSLFFTESHHLSEASTGTVLSALALAGGIGALAMPRVASRFGSVGSLVVLRIICAAMIGVAVAPLGLLGVLPALVIYYGIADGSDAIFVSEVMHRLDARERVWFSGLNAMAWSLMSAGASLLSGINQDRHAGSFGVAFLVGAGGYLISALWIAGLFRTRLASKPLIVSSIAIEDIPI